MIYIDNTEVATWVNNQLGYTFDYPYNTIEPDWDVIAQSAKYMQWLDLKLMIEHVKSQQDDECNF
eukprot:4865573-Ditylum_brightwellii.AAC.1